MIDKTYLLHIDKAVPPVAIDCTEGDTAWRWHFQIYNSGSRWTIPTGSTILFTGHKPDGNVFDIEGSLTNNEAIVDADAQITAVDGVVPCVVRVIDTYGKIVASCPVVLHCKPNPQSMGNLSDTVLSAYDAVLQRLGDAVGVQKNVTDWMDEHITQPSTPVVDTSLSVLGAAADALATGAAVEALQVEAELISGYLTGGWEAGAINASTGDDESSATRIRTGDFLPNNIRVTIGDGVKVRAVLYDAEKSCIGSGVWRTADYTISSEDAVYVRLFAGYNDDSTLSSDDLYAVSSKITIHETGASAFRYRGNMEDLGYTAFSECAERGYYSFSASYYPNITDKPDRLLSGGIVIALPNFAGGVRYQTIIATNARQWARYGSNAFDEVNNPRVSDTVWYALGDSITQGYYSANGEIAGVTDRGYPYWVSQYNNWRVTNYGVGGSGYLHAATVGDGLNARQKVDTIDFSECDLVTLAFGVNDWHYHQVIGSVADDPSSETSMASNMKYCIEKILSDNPMCRIVVILPMNCSKYGGNFESNWGLGTALTTSGTLQDVIDVEKAICEYYGIPYIDQSKTGIVNRTNIQSALPDGIHPALSLYKQIGKALAQQIQFV